ncbi:HAAS signaling domain-containing protein [Oceanobacillus jeddahense]|uniref:HAAS signaling domain-containing protein n=1 Tax=Oceanobacillus jeddahense TaxID=1462527 RepID=UPI00364150AE
MEMINRYIYAVTQRLPQSQRKDIADELRGLIEDMLEDRAGNDNVKDSEVEEVLLELGSPRELADKYRVTKKYIIGPELFDSYILVVKIVLIVISSLIGVGFVIQTILDPTSILDYFVDMIVSFVTVLPTAFGWTTFWFAIGELCGGKKQKDISGHEWKPSDLPPIPDEKRQIKRSESIIGIIFYTIIIVFLAFSNDYFGIWVFQDGFTRVVPFLNEQTYGTYLLFILLIFGAGIIKECLKLVSGKWTYKLAIYTTIVNVISMAAILFMITWPDFWNPDFINELVEAGIVEAGSETFDTVTTIWNQSTFWIFILFIIGLAWDAVDGFIKSRKK